jgi:hypothetical protein
MSNYDKLSELVGKLEKYCEHENDEHGEFVRGLCYLVSYSYCFDDDFANALIAQMEYELNNYDEFCRIVKSEVTYTNEYTELEWDNG